MIYIVVTPFWPHDKKVHGSYIWDQVLATKKTGVFSKVLVFVPKYNGIQPIPLDKTLGEVCTFKFHSMPSYFFNGLLNVFNFIHLRRMIRSKLRDKSEKIILHVHTSGFRFALDILRGFELEVIKVLHHHDLDPYNICHGGWINNRASLIFRAINARCGIESADINLCISQKVADNIRTFPSRLEQNYSRYIERLSKVRSVKAANAKMVAVLHNGVDLTKFNINPKIQEYRSLKNYRKDGVIIGCVANYIELKDHITLLRAVRHISCEGRIVHLRLLGQGPLKEDLIKQVQSLSMKDIVEFVDEVEHTKMNEFYNSLDLFVLPSKFEGFGCVLFESLACGVPFFAAKNQGVDEFFQGENRDKYLFNPGDYLELSLRLNDFINKKIIGMPIDIRSLDLNVLATKFIEVLDGYKKLKSDVK